MDSQVEFLWWFLSKLKALWHVHVSLVHMFNQFSGILTLNCSVEVTQSTLYPVSVCHTCTMYVVELYMYHT